MMDLHQALDKYFGFGDFLPGQEEIIRAVLEREHVLGILPTGGGKSLCFQLPGLMLPGLTLVISPLVALMKDQVDALHEKELFQATFINSQLTFEEYRERLSNLRRGQYKLLYLAPERLRSRYFLEAIQALQVSLLVIDEAHCVSQWGHDFRPDYLWIPRFYRWLKGSPRLLALTATATPAVQEDIIDQLDVPDAYRVLGNSDRTNLYFSVRQVAGEKEKFNLLKNVLDQQAGSGIIYAGTRKDCEKIAHWLRHDLKRPAVFYHAGLKPEKRTEVQEKFVSGKVPVVVATNAFGMGIDKANIRFVIHYALPGSLEAYYQEVGRAGRDGKPAFCLLLYAPRDKGLQSWMVENEVITAQDVRKLVKHIRSRQDEQKVVLNLRELENQELGETKLRFLISEMEHLGLIKNFERTSEALGLVLTGDVLEKNLAPAIKRSEELARDKKKKLAAMVDYAVTNRCRRVSILSYFGEEPTGRAEQCCDYCDRGADTELVISKLPLAVLDCMEELPREVGRLKLVDILRGSQSYELEEYGYTELVSYGLLKGFSKEVVLKMIDNLLADEYIQKEEGRYPVLRLAAKGRTALNKDLALPMYGLEYLAAEENSAGDDAYNRLVERLRKFRADLAKQTGKPAFLFFHDSTLEELALKQPHSKESLLNVKGLGQKKVEAFGDDLLEVIISSGS